MTPEKIAEAAGKLIQGIKDQRGGTELAEMETKGDNPYKPFYGACAVLLAPTHTFLRDVLDGEVPTVEEAKAICSAAHPWYADAIEKDPEHFETVYGFVWEAWYDWPEEKT